MYYHKMSFQEVSLYMVSNSKRIKQSLGCRVRFFLSFYLLTVPVHTYAQKSENESGEPLLSSH